MGISVGRKISPDCQAEHRNVPVSTLMPYGLVRQQVAVDDDDKRQKEISDEQRATNTKEMFLHADVVSVKLLRNKQ